MAGVATAFSTDALTSGGPESSSQWEFSVPIGSDGAQHSARQRNSHDSNSARARSIRQRNSNGSRSSSVSRTVHAHDAPFLSGRGRREQSQNRYEINSPRDAGHEASVRASVDGQDESFEFNSESWIHRDKLAKIESEELHQAAIIFQRRIRAESKSSAGRERSHDSHHSGAASLASPNTEHQEPWPQLQESRIDRANGENKERQHWDLRRPEEIAADEAAAGFYNQPALRKSSSRIPIAAASPVPIMGRDSRGPRSRAATDEDDEGRGRRASEPLTTEMGPSTPSPGSRPGSRGFNGFNTTQNTPAKKNSTKMTGSSNRKTSAPPANRKTSTARSRAVSSNTTQRPTTRSGEIRPTTSANRPEGDPPWLATMYKPDPRLPPDQQMLPTLAKKMQQEQWEKEGRTPNTYDRDFAPLAVYPDDMPSVPRKAEEPVEEPLQIQIEEPPKARTPEPPRPNTSTGYSTMPKVQDTPPLGLTPNPNWTPPVVTAQEKPKKEKSCGCCVVM
ncbi:hypothetical protein N7520_007784 [Penicillium odoratum]|uniref:uncharacterized protein n=1 Tax=Penicillium odoratum TaxID=1167516 RepID=UPI002548E374|nr:uncharacterized protein N7520_007784 [Penicillium odoratum]KAJ5760628.1 hypothetical protein N7520_007784 [Penicillium odoratum]